MELYGSLFNISGSVTASAFTGSYIGDGAGLYNLPASGVTGLNLSQISSGGSVASINSTGFTVNTDTQVQGNLSVTGALIANQYIVSSSVVYMTTSFASGSSAFGNDNSDVHQFTGSVQITGSISLNGQAIGTGKLDETVFQSYTSSNDARVLALETSSGSLNSFTSSINTTIKSKLDAEGVISGSVQVNITGTTGYNTFSSSISSSIADVSSSVAITTSGLTSTITSLSSSIGSISSSVATTTSDLSSSIGSLSSSIATTDLDQTNRLISIENKTGSYATTGSNIFIGNQTISGSILPSVDNTYDLGSPTYQWRDVYISSGSLYIDGTKVLGSTTQELTITTDTGQSIKILEAGTDSIILQTADGDVELKSSGGGDILLDPTNGIISIKGTTQIQDGYKITSSGGTNVVFADGIIVSGSIQLTGTIDDIDLQSFSSSINTRIGDLESSAGSLNSFTASATNRLVAIETATSSLNTFTSSIDTTIKNKLNADGIISGSVQVILTGTTGYSTFSSSISASIGDLSGSIATTTLNTKNRVDSIEDKTGSYATTGSNTFKSNQTISGSVIITENLTVFGSSSITYVTSSQLRIEDNIITVNTASPGSRFGGLEVHDSGSVGIATGSLLWDSVNNRWVYQQSSESTYGGGVLLSGPRSSGSLGSELTLTSGRVAKSAGGDHLNDSNITDNGTLVSINSNTEITGTLVISSTIVSQGTSLVSGSGQISYVGITNIPSGIVSGSAQVTALLPAGTVSGSSQITYGSLSGIPSGIVSGSSQVLNSSGVWSGSAQLPSGVVSGSSQISFGSITGIPGGLVSGSSQIDLTSTTNYASGILTRLNAVGVFSSSAQVSFGSITGIPGGLVSGSSQVLSGTGIWSGSAQLPSGVVSGSSQVLAGTTIHSGTFFNGITVVSGSSQVSFGGISGVPSGLVSGSSQVLAGTTIHSGSFFNGITVVSGSAQVSFSGIAGVPSGLVSGSSQISFGSVSGVPSGLVSGSSQITLSSTSGFGSYLNQAVLTTSSPTFDSPIVTGTMGMNTSSSRNKYNVYSTGASAYAIGMQSAITYGGLNDWGMTFQFNNDDGRGFWWGDEAHTTAQGAMSLTTNGNLTVARRIRIGYGESDTTTPTLPLQVYGSGGVIVDIQGANGQLFSVTDDLTGDIFSVSDISGMPLLNVNTTTGTGFGYTAYPLVNNLYDLGTAALRWANVYTNDLHLSNEGKTGGNDIDGTTGDWTIQEGAEQLYIINNKNGKKFRINLTEIE